MSGFLRLIGVALFVMLVANPAGATLIGISAELKYDNPTKSTPPPPGADTGTFVVLADGFTEPLTFSGINFTITFHPQELVITQLNATGTFTGAIPFNGIQFIDFTDASITGTTDPATTMAGFNNSRITTGPSNNLFFDFQGLFTQPGDVVAIDVQQPSQVPEPASLALFGSALVGFGFHRRRKRKS